MNPDDDSQTPRYPIREPTQVQGSFVSMQICHAYRYHYDDSIRQKHLRFRWIAQIAISAPANISLGLTFRFSSNLRLAALAFGEDRS